MKHAWRAWLWHLLREAQPAKVTGGARIRPTFEILEDRTLPSAFPFVQSINRALPAGPVTTASSVSYTVTFSEAVTGVVPADFQLALTGTVAATLTQVTPVSASVYTVTVSSITGIGTLELNLVDNNSIHDLAGNPLTQQNAAPAFNTPPILAVGSAPYSAVLGDLNGDGKLDLVVANEGNNTVSVLLGNGNGTFQAQQTFATGTSPDSVAVADFNGDGKPDLVVANVGSNTVSVLLGNGNGTFQPQQTFADRQRARFRGGGGRQRRRQARPRRRQQQAATP